jgi:hypothetical protein
MDAETPGVHAHGMDVAYVSALSALGGSMVGGLTSGITTWLSLRAQARAGQRAHDKSLREDLYRDFVVAASKAYGEAIPSNDPRIQEIVTLYAIINRMGILSSPCIVAWVLSVIAPLSGFNGRARFPDHTASRIRSAVMPRVRNRWRRKSVGTLRLRRE